ncbi:MAG: riboflavin biosynthesis protein RibF [Ezakiella sp.]|nr:riboflavin biosynthesis protein RibF [Ezakiella sp.]MDD7471958.1 riboflavin biosynthesis protein RibF [Bacillota bacterium]MDY3923922.1 riboflavin biosynthesis protein RibF [Ezakiella sp.]
MEVATIGYFDGVHIGHQKLINKVIETAKLNNETSAVLTFDMSTFSFKVTKEITNEFEKEAIFKEMGIDKVYKLNLSELKDETPEEFLNNIKKRTSTLVVGDDFRFGKDRVGDVDFINANQDKNFKVIICEDVYDGENKISSTYIRNLIKNGELKKANSLMYKNYSLSGEVITGFQRGRTIGYNTANMKIPKNKILPKEGVYLTRVKVANFDGYGMTMIGLARGFNKEVTCETNIFNFNKFIYGENLTIEFIDYLRENIKINSLEELKVLLDKDKKNCMKILENALQNK